MKHISLLLCFITSILAGAITITNMEVIRQRPGIATSQNKVFIAGGDTAFDGPTALVSIFSVSSRQFLAPANLTRPRVNVIGLSFSNTVLFIDTNTSEVERYNPNTNSFSVITIPGLVAPFAASSVNNKAVFVSRGFTGLVYNVDTGVTRPWSLCTSQCEERNEGIATAVLRNKVFFAGGGVAGSRRVDIYSDDLGSFTSQSQALSIPRTYLSSAVTSDRVVFAGGPRLYPNTDEARANCGTQSVLDIYNIQTNSFTTSQLPLPRFDFGMASADGDYVLFAEGVECSTQFTSNITQVYNAARNTFGPTLQSQGSGTSTVGFTVSSKAVFVGGGLNQYQPLVEIFSHTQRMNSFQGGTNSDFAVLSNGGEGFLAGGVAPRPTSTFVVINV